MVITKAIRSGSEFGWRQDDVLATIEAARKLKLAVTGGQVQYVLPEGTFELYWLTYDPEERRKGEKWIDYCNRTADEMTTEFKTLVAKTDFEKEALASFDFLRGKKMKGANIEDYRVFIIYFDDMESDLWCGE